MSNIKATSATQTIKLTASTKQAEKIVIKPGQAIQLMVDGQLYTGQQHINGKAVRLVRKGRTLEVQLDEQSLAVVEDFYANEGAATGQTQALSEQDTLALLQEGSAVQVAAAPDGEAAVALPQWGTLVAQANTSTTGGAAAATTSAAPAATGVGMGTVLLGALGLAALASSGGSSSSTPTPVPTPPDTTAPTATVTDNVPGTATGAVTYTIAFNEAVKGFDASKITASAGTLSDFVASADGKTFTIVLTPPANATGSAQLSISTSGVIDAAGNTAVAPTVAAQAYDTVPPDTTAPTVNVTDNVTGTATGPVTYTVKFSESVTGFDASKLSLSGGTLGGLVKVSDSEYTVVATPAATATGTLQLTVGASGVADAAGNAAVAPAVASQAYAQNVLQGNIVAGPVVGTHSLSVKVFNDKGQAIASAMVDASGNYKVALGNYTGPVSVLVVDADNTQPDYVDEVSKKPVDLSGYLLVAGSVGAGNTVQTLNINPITTVAALKAGLQVSTDGASLQTGSVLDATKISTANAAVAIALLGSSASTTDLLTANIVPTVNADGSANASANNYGKMLAVLSGMDAANSGDSSKTLSTLVSGISDSGSLGGNALSALMQGASAAGVPASVVPGASSSGGGDSSGGGGGGSGGGTPNTAPTATDGAITILEDFNKTFTADDFGFSDTDGNTLQAVIISTLPMAGTLKLNGQDVTLNQSIAAADLGQLVYAPAANANGANYATIGFKVQDNGGTNGGGVNTSAAKTLTVSVTSVNDAPSGADAEVSLMQNSSRAFAASDFGFSDTDGNTLQAVIISTLPMAGTLKLNGQDVTLNQSIAAADLGQLVYAPAANANGANYATIGFKVQDNGGTNGGGVNTSAAKTLTVSITATPNTAPTATDGAITILEDFNKTFTADDFGFSDTDGNTLQAVIISTLPMAGTLKLNGQDVTLNQSIAAADLGQLVYAPAANANGANYATIGFKVQDNGGTNGGGVNTSAAKTLTVSVTSVNDAATGTAELSGTAEQSGILTAVTSGITDPDGTSLTFSYQWQIAGTVNGNYTSIPNAMADSYTIPTDQSQVGKFLRVVVTANNDGTVQGTSFTSNPSTAVADTVAPTLLTTSGVRWAYGSGENLSLSLLTIENQLDASNTPVDSQFTLTAPGSPVNLQSIRGNNVYFSIQAPNTQINAGYLTTISYVDPSAENDSSALQLQGGDDVASWSNYVVHNMAEGTVASLQTQLAQYTAPITLRFSESVLKGSGNIQLINARTGAVLEDITVDDNRVSISNDEVSIQFDRPLVSDDTYLIRMDAGALIDSSNNAVSTVINVYASGMGDMDASRSLYDSGITDELAQASWQQFVDIEAMTHSYTSSKGNLQGTQPLSQYINQVTGTDIVSSTEFSSGFSITGILATGLSVNDIRFYLDNNREDGIDNAEQAQLVNGQNGVLYQYNSTTGDFQIDFAANSTALRPGTVRTASSGVHKLWISTNDDGVQDSGEPSRLFLVSPETATLTDDLTHNYTIKDTASNQIFVYFAADVDGSSGVGVLTYDPSTSVDADGLTPLGLGAAWNYFKTTQAADNQDFSANGLMLNALLDLPKQIYEFHTAINSSNYSMNFSDAKSYAEDHTSTGSNSSRMLTTAEAMALYAANFGADNGAGYNTVGDITPLTHEMATTANMVQANNNAASSWANTLWTSNSFFAAANGSNYTNAALALNYGYINELTSGNTAAAAYVL